MRLFTLLTFFAFGGMFAQTKRDFNYLPEVWPDTITLKTDSLIFKPITEKEYTAINNRPVKKKKQQIVPAGIVKDSTLIVTTKKSVFELPAKGGYESSWNYAEYVPELQAHLLNHCGEGACFAELLDYETDDKMAVPSSYDQGLMGFLVSPEGKYLLVYSSYDGSDYDEYYNARSEFILYKITGKGLKGLSYHRLYESVEWSIEEIIWDDDTTLALKVYTEDRTGNGENLTYKYYKAVIK